MRFQPGQSIDHYEVVAALGEGAYAETYKARDTRTGEVVVLKCANPLLFSDPGLFQRYRRETEVARKLNHRGVQRGLDAGEDRSEPYLVLEYVDGVNLRHRLRELRGPVPLDLAVDWGRQLAETLAYLHGQGIVHRDLKPENILVDQDGTLKVADFGTAMLRGARRLTWRHLSESLGTPDYMSPEQIQGERGDPRSDIYAWGVMMYEFLTGRVPFEGDNWMAVMQGHLQRTPTRIRHLRRDVPPDLEGVVLTAMRRHPENRYQSATELLADLDHVGSEPVPPARPAVAEPVPAGPPPARAPAPAAWAPTAPGPPRRTYDLSPEAPMGGMAAAGSAGRLWAYAALIAGGFIAVVAVAIVLTLVLK
ncbi:MAG TPA: serine/threonine-protein kinase [Acidimicrobiales bacterium]|nr:serine/threonine-protein kinase [Acidimicrobiales bacterium]